MPDSANTKTLQVIKLKVLFLRCLRRHRLGYLPHLIPLLKEYSYKDLRRATDGFCRIVARHPHSVTYDAKLDDGSVALVKEVRVRGAEQEQDTFYREVQLLGCLHHRHLVHLRGYSSGRQSFLVFESTRYGSLKEHLNDPLKTPLNWKTRLRIAVAVAAALEYLWHFCDPRVYHVSVSSSSILLNEKYCAKLSDISIVDPAMSHVEFPQSSSIEECIGRERQNLIPQFGALILELITGQSSEKGSTEVIRWVQESDLGASMHKMIDPDLGNSYDVKVLGSLLALARLCIKADLNKPAFSISHVLLYLQQKLGLLHD